MEIKVIKKHSEQKRIALVNKVLKLEDKSAALQKQSEKALSEAYAIKMKIFKGDY